MKRGEHAAAIVRQVRQNLSAPLDHQADFFQGLLERVTRSHVALRAFKPTLAVLGLMMVLAVFSTLSAVHATGTVERLQAHGFDHALSTLRYDLRASQRRNATSDLRCALEDAIEELRLARDRYGDMHATATLEWLRREVTTR